MRSFVALGQPVPKGRPRCRVGRRADGQPYAQIYTPKDTADAETTILRCYQNAHPGAEPYDGPIWMVMVFWRKSAPGRRADIDNYQKTVLDALNGHAYTDDSLVRSITALIKDDAAEPMTDVYLGSVYEWPNPCPDESLMDAIAGARSRG